MVSERDWRPQVAGFARVRPERPSDVRAIHSVVSEAFGGAPEARVVAAMREAGGLALSLVAEHDGLSGDGAILGHVSFSPLTIGGEGLSPPALGLAPLSVRPAWQRQGIGAALVRAGLYVCRRRGIGLVFLLGDPGYYRRFGFEAASRYGFTWNKANVGRAFQVIGLCADPADFGEGGVVRYRPEFDLLDP